MLISSYSTIPFGLGSQGRQHAWILAPRLPPRLENILPSRLLYCHIGNDAATRSINVDCCLTSLAARTLPASSSSTVAQPCLIPDDETVVPQHRHTSFETCPTPRFYRHLDLLLVFPWCHEVSEPEDASSPGVQQPGASQRPAFDVDDPKVSQLFAATVTACIHSTVVRSK